MRPTLEELFCGAKDKKERDVRIYKAVFEHGYRLAEVGDYLGLHYSTVSRIVSKQRSKLKTCPRRLQKTEQVFQGERV